jgi:hypothetical protein
MVCWGNVKESNHLENMGTDERKLVKWILKKYKGRACSGFIWLRTGTGGVGRGCCEHGSKQSGSIKSGCFLN